MIKTKWNVEAVKAYETGQGVELVNEPYPHYVPSTTETKDEPVGWIDSKGNMICTKINESCKPLYTTPQQKQEQDEPWLLNTAQNLAKFMARNFYPEVTHWKVSDNLVSVILQIDNMVTGLIRKSKQEQGEPVAWFRKENGENIYYATKAWDDCLPLYTTPQTKKWVELTNNELVDLTIKNAGFPILLAQEIADKLKDKNT